MSVLSTEHLCGIHCFFAVILTGLFQVQEMKSARDSGELQLDTLKDEVDQLRTWKDKVILPCAVSVYCVL